MITKTNIYVKHSDIDSMGIVHHSIYPGWFEAGRIDFLKKVLLPRHIMNARGFFLPLTELKCNYKSPAKYGDEIMLVTSLIYLSCVKLKLEYKAINISTGKIISNGITVHAWTNKKLEPINLEKTAPDIFNHLKQFVIGESKYEYKIL